MVVAIVAVEASRLELLDLLKREGRGVELATAVVLFWAVVVYAVTRGHAGLLSGWHVALLFLAMAARELDFDKRFLDEGMLQLRLYSGDAPVWQKAVGACVFLAILAALARLIGQDLRPWLRALAARAPWAWMLLLAVATVVLAKTIDGAGRKLEPFGVTLGERLDLALGVGEESLELAFALMLLVALILAPARGLASR